MRNGKIVSALMLVFLPFGFAAAQDIPLPLLESDRKSCKATCEKAFSGKQCSQLCDCTIAAVQAKVSFDQYLQMTAEVSQNKLSKSNIALMDKIALQCSRQIFEAKPQLVAAPTVKAADQPKQ